MEKDPAIRNQKVYVTLNSVLQIQSEFEKAIRDANEAKEKAKVENSGSSAQNSAERAVARARGMATIIRELGLGITVPQGY